MQEILIKLSPIFLLFGLGIVLRKVRFVDTVDAEFLLRLVFFVTLPALVLLRLSQTPLTWDKIYLPLINIAINLCCMAATLMVPRFAEIPRKTLGAMLVSTMIANNVFMFPFIMVGFGDAGFADAVLFDFGNGLTTATITYLMAFKYGATPVRSTAMMIKLMQSPLFWAFAIAIGMSLFSLGLPNYLAPFLENVGQMTSPLILIALGIFFRPQFADLKLVSLTIFIRVGLGLAVGVGLATLLGLTGQTFSVVLICSAAPVGFMALTFSAIAQLDKEFTSKVVSISILLGILYVPLLMFLVGS
ncbi:AEC family transporter [Desulfobacula sp.]|uniref:AEC family transporter n=1 Tax=Desulfobacula sp. TaxID=2593537 RepID=UPI002607E776|nr:AEC family transporter [Desulfobacula sp.]